MYHQYSKQLEEIKDSEFIEEITPDSKTYKESTQKMRKNLVRTSYYGKRDSDYYLDDEECDESLLNLRINVLGDLILLCEVFKMPVSINFMTLVVKIALNQCESKIASCIVADYNANLSENMIERALKTDQMDFIYTIWSYKRNKSHTSGMIMKFEYLFSKIIEICGETYVAKINQVVYWTIKTKENMLKSLLVNNADFAAIQYYHLYMKDIDMELLIFCIKNTNEEFLKKALKDNIFTNVLLDNSVFIDTLLDLLKFGTKIDLLLNVLGYMQFTCWSQTQLKSFVEVAYNIIHEKFETNIISLASNPVLSICLICECLTKIGDYTNFLK